MVCVCVKWLTFSLFFTHFEANLLCIPSPSVCLLAGVCVPYSLHHSYPSDRTLHVCLIMCMYIDWGVLFSVGSPIKIS